MALFFLFEGTEIRSSVMRLTRDIFKDFFRSWRRNKNMVYYATINKFYI